DLDRVHHVLGAWQHLIAIGRRLDLPLLARQLNQLLSDGSRELEALGVDVDKGESAAVETVDREDVGDDLARENGASCPDHGDLRHGRAPLQRTGRDFYFVSGRGEALLSV